MAALIVALAGVAGADEEQDAKDHFLRGKTAYIGGQYEKAVSAFKAAAGLRPSPILDFNIARCYDKLGRVDEAVAAYERFLAKAKKDAPNRNEARARVAELKKKSKAEAPRDPYEDLDKKPPPASAPVLLGAARPPAPPAPRRYAAPPPEEPGAPSPRRGIAERAEAEPQHEAAGGAAPPRSAGPARPPQAATAGPRPGAPPPAPPRQDTGPFYKQWWFWTACAAGALIAGFIIATAVSSDGGSPSRHSGLTVRF